jgi:hypothetical protein
VVPRIGLDGLEKTKVSPLSRLELQPLGSPILSNRQNYSLRVLILFVCRQQTGGHGTQLAGSNVILS